MKRDNKTQGHDAKFITNDIIICKHKYATKLFENVHVQLND